jgi:glutamate synthase (NADPH/NADH) small chain
MWDIMTKSFEGKNGKVIKANAVKVEWKEGENGRMMPVELPGSEFEIEADYVFLAMGFTGPEKAGILEQLGVEYDARGNVKCDDNFMTSVDGVFAAGDVVSGASLVVRAIAAGRQMADGVNNYLNS